MVMIATTTVAQTAAWGVVSEQVATASELEAASSRRSLS